MNRRKLGTPMHVLQRQEYVILLVFFVMILVLQSLIQRNGLFDFGLRLEYQN